MRNIFRTVAALLLFTILVHGLARAEDLVRIQNDVAVIHSADEIDLPLGPMNRIHLM